MELSTQIDQWLPKAAFTGIEPGRHHSYNFLVYEVTYKGIDIICKVRDVGEKIVHTMRIK